MKILKIILSVLFVVCLFEMPYGYYQLVRMIALIGFAILAYDAFNHQKNILVIVYGGLALLFQPFIKVVLHRQIWNIVDVIVALLLILSIFLLKDKDEKPSESNLKL